MRISTKGLYAVRLMIYLTTKGQSEPVSLKEISETQCISKKYLEQITPSLTGAKLLKSTRGASGGYKLARPADKISIYDILDATEGSLSPVGALDDGDLEWTPASPFLEGSMWRGLDSLIREYLSGITLQKIVDDESPVAADSYAI